MDFGCGSGRDAIYFCRKGFVVDAVDGSERLVELANRHAEINVRRMLFSELDAVEEYDGIWACSSILHLPSIELKSVLLKMIKALKINGWIYTSFKYGEAEEIRNGRYFIDFTEDSFRTFMSDIYGADIKESWITGDARLGRGDEKSVVLL